MEELKELFKNFSELRTLDLAEYYCCTDDIPPVLEAYRDVAARLRSSFSEGFKSEEIRVITRCCSGLVSFPRLIHITQNNQFFDHIMSLKIININKYKYLILK